MAGDFKGGREAGSGGANYSSYNVAILTGDGLGGLAAAVNFGVGESARVKFQKGDVQSDPQTDRYLNNAVTHENCGSDARVRSQVLPALRGAAVPSSRGSNWRRFVREADVHQECERLLDAVARGPDAIRP